ncbi:uncharacterized protein LOC110255245 isoform X4 [Sus scrofa]|uniref:uncharacterized protein LOC110255245 isoform X4 n=1 Tax=Sus scrofa TaxID=9823 RepID=UPI000A2B07F6|nr:uncharacterized protein LOC110255245 isoform X4 [Sus scrofa]
MGRFQVPPFAGALIFGIRFLCFLPLRRAGITIPGRGSSAPRCAEFSCGRPRLTPPSLQLSAAEMKPPGAAPRRPEPGFLPRYVQRLENSSLDTAVTETALRPLPLSRCSELGELGGEADPGATCCPSRLNHENVKGKNCFAIHWPPQQTSPGTESAPNTEEVDLLNFFPVPERCPWLLSLEDSSPAGAAEITLSTEPKIFTTWPFIGKVCQLLL